MKLKVNTDKPIDKVHLALKESAGSGGSQSRVLAEGCDL